MFSRILSYPCLKFMIDKPYDLWILIGDTYCKWWNDVKNFSSSTQVLCIKNEDDHSNYLAAIQTKIKFFFFLRHFTNAFTCQSATHILSVQSKTLLAGHDLKYENCLELSVHFGRQEKIKILMPCIFDGGSKIEWCTSFVLGQRQG